MDNELRDHSNSRKPEERTDWVRPEVRKIDAGAAEAGAAAGGDFGALS